MTTTYTKLDDDLQTLLQVRVPIAVGHTLGEHVYMVVLKFNIDYAV